MNLTSGRCAECLAPVNGGSAGHQREISCIPAPNHAGRGDHVHQRASKKSPRLLAEAEATARTLVHDGGGPSVINAATMELVMDGQLVRPAWREWQKRRRRRVQSVFISAQATTGEVAGRESWRRPGFQG
jgi:hypothetical protein